MVKWISGQSKWMQDGFQKDDAHLLIGIWKNAQDIVNERASCRSLSFSLSSLSTSPALPTLTPIHKWRKNIRKDTIQTISSDHFLGRGEEKN